MFKTMNTKRLIVEAAAAGDVEAVRDLLEADPVLVNTHSSDGWTPLHLAAHFGHLHVAEELLAHGADVDARASNHLGTTPLLWGVIGQDVALVTLLLDHGADVNEASTSGSTPLHKAAVLGNASLTRLLLVRGANCSSVDTASRGPRALSQVA